MTEPQRSLEPTPTGAPPAGTGAARRKMAWWILPGMVGAGLLGTGVWLAGGWQDYSLIGRTGVVLLWALGGLLLTAVGLAWLLLFLLRRFFRGMKRDAKSLGWQIGYMLRGGRHR